MQQSFEVLDQLVVERIAFLADKEGFQAFQGEKQPGVDLDPLTLQALQILENIAPDEVPVGASLLGEEAAEDVGGDLQHLGALGIEFQVGGVVNNEVFLKRLEIPVADHELRVVLVDGQTLIGVENHGGKAIVAGLEDAELV